MFLVNRSTDAPVEIAVDLGPGAPAREIVEAVGVWDDDPFATNSPEQPERVALRTLDGAVVQDGVLRLTLPPVSWAAVSLRG